MECRAGCGACCIAPSIHSPIPGMPNGKPAGVRCIQLDVDNRCLLFDKPERPLFCVSLKASVEMCGHAQMENPNQYALLWLTDLEKQTKP